MLYPVLIIPIVIVTAAPSNLINPFVITGGNCGKNISIKYQVPVTRNRSVRQNSEHTVRTSTEQYIDYEERIGWDTVYLCCPGYRTIIFGLCEPICEVACPEKSYCVEPNKCDCIVGYEPSHHPNKEHPMICRPVCNGGCPEHSHCVAHNKCECRAGFKDVSAWFAPVRCERIQCAAPDQRYDIHKRSCVKIEMSVEELMQRVGEKLAHDLGMTTSDFENDVDSSDEDENDQRSSK